MKTRKIAVISVLALMLVSLPGLTLSRPKPVAARGTEKAWTYLVYMAADNNLDTWGDFSLDLMKKGLTSDQDINVVVLYDHPNAPTDLLQVKSAGVVPLTKYYPNTDNLDTGVPATLQAFLSWGVQNYPADHYAVDIWSHGGGWKYIVLDSTSGDRMSIDGLGNAMGAVTKALHRKFDITIFDACLMSMVEVADQLKPVTNYILASEQSVPYQGFPYDAMLQQLSTNISMDSWTYSKLIADDYYNFYVGTSGKSGLSISAVDEGKLPTLITAIDNFPLTLIANMATYHSQVNSARSNAQHQIGGTDGTFWYVDLHRFADQIAFRINDATIDSQAAAVSASVESTLYERHSHNLDGTAYGIGVNFPPNLSRYMDKNYLAQNYQGVNLVFTAETHWDEMLLEFYKY
jgi:hypothetical protein